MSNFKTACIYYHPKLKLESKSYEIANGIKIARTKNSKAAESLFQLREEQNLTQVGGESSYDLCLIIDGYGPPFSDYSDPYSLLNKVSNFLAINTFSPVVEGNVITTKNNFQTAEFVGQLYDYNHAKFEHFITTDGFEYISHNNIHNIKRSWRNYRKTLGTNSNERLSQALNFYYYSWNSPHLEPICINLAIVFELLFAPHSRSETTHQIAYNVAHYLTNNSTERENIYKEMKKFYGKRSSIIHGGLPKNKKLVKPTRKAFKRCSKILRGILVDEELIEIFNNEKKRKKMIKSYLFE